MTSQASSDRYKGEVAASYDANRYRGSKWEGEQSIVRNMLRTFPEGSSLLDVPFGTGRFLSFYKEQALHVLGGDISVDMLEIGSQKARDIDYPVTLFAADIRAMPCRSGAFDCVLCIRLFNLMPSDACLQGFEEIARISRGHVILGIRYFIPVRDLLLSRRIRDFCFFFLQAGRRVFGRKGQTIHTKKAVDEMFSREGFRVDDVQRVERRKDGTDYCIFHLVRMDE